MIQVDPTLTESAVAEAEAQHAADMYLGETLGAGYYATSGIHGNHRWYFLIHSQQFSSVYTSSLGKIAVDAATGKVIPLTDEQIRDIREDGAVQAAAAHGELARDEQGHVLRYHAQRQATQWLSDHVTMHFSATDGLFVPLDQARWQFSIRFRLPRIGEIKSLGTIDVNAITGEVMPLSHQEQRAIQERARAVIRDRELAPAA